MITACPQLPIRGTANERGVALNTATGFTLVELLVTLMIISILAGLSLAGLAGARQRAKIDKTRSTIRKIDAVIRPMYDSYRTRRVDSSSVSTPSSTQCPRCYVNGAQQANLVASWKRLIALRYVLVAEMPDCWADIPASVSSLPTYAQTAVANAYNAAATNPKRTSNEQFEPLFLIASRSGFEPDALESFRADEIGDTDSDGASEFLDGWGKPIVFWRWAPGFTASSLQAADADKSHDPLDPQRVDATGFAMIPLIVSGGPDELPGLTQLSSGWLGATSPLSSLLITSGGSLVGAPLAASPTDYLDNITNHDLSRK